VTLKFPHGLTKVCREKKLLTLVKFWYQLKKQSTNGYLSKGSLSSLNCHHSQFWPKLKKLSQLGYIRLYKNGYALVSYDCLWKSLGYTYSFKRKEETIERRNNFRILKVSDTEIDYVWDELDRLLVFNSFKRQEKATSTVTTTMPKYTKEYINGSLNHVYSVIIDGSIEQKAESALNLFKFKNANLDVSLSCKGFARILGYKSSYSGHLHQHKFYEPVKRCVKVITEWNDYFGKETVKQLRSLHHRPFFYDKSSGGIYLQLCNQI